MSLWEPRWSSGLERPRRDATGLFHCSHYSATANSNTSQICRSSRRTTNMRRSIPWWAILGAVPFLILFRWRFYRRLGSWSFRRGLPFCPPLAIEIRINSDQLVAASMEYRFTSEAATSFCRSSVKSNRTAQRITCVCWPETSL